HYRLVIGASEDDQLNQKLSDQAMRHNIPVNVVDRPESCSFTVPSIVDRSPLIVAVSSSGQSPTLAKVVRRRIETMLPLSYGSLAKMIGTYRSEVLKRPGSYAEKKRFWERLLSGPLVDLFLSGQEETAQRVMRHEVDNPVKSGGRGTVLLAGAGPGDPELLTLRTLRHLQTADALVFDRLVSEGVMEYANPEAERFYVGKKDKDHFRDQSEINEKLIELARQGKKVVRLKGGDPFIFGRGGEELEALLDAGIDFQVIPGITAASGCCAYAGIPLTHRDYAQSCQFITAHGKDDMLELNWESLTLPGQTLVFYMGLGNAGLLSRKLIEYGMPAKAPAAVIQNGTSINQKVVLGSIEKLEKTIATHKIRQPGLIIVGETVKLHSRLKWYN
ncbi:MAG TPA: siroheme synthase CysG, partial [SAR324 cluster bacterium]|nr:siroheme synthase CysG [SAR324 cluster bacterium]